MPSRQSSPSAPKGATPDGCNSRYEKIQRQVFKNIEQLTKLAMDNKDLKTALKGLELQGKYLGMFIENMRLSDSQGHDLEPPALTVLFKSKSK